MAEITSPNSNNKKGKPAYIKRSTRVDLTPMVDLGFILVTFFVFTSTLFQVKAMDMEYPNDKSPDSHDDLCESCVLTVLPAKQNKLWYYEGKETNAVFKEISYNDLRKLLISKKQKVQQQRGMDEMRLIIRPLETSQYHNLVDIMDDCAITGVARYYIDEPSEKEVKRFE